jgi:hypothetical protein
MSSYTTFPPFKNFSGTVQARNHGTIVLGGNAGSQFKTVTPANNTLGSKGNFSQSNVGPNFNTGISPIQLNNAVALSGNITQNGSTGYIKVNANSHGWSVGQVIIIAGTDVVHYNVPQIVTVVVDSNNVQTNVAYESNATVAGTYQTGVGNFSAIVPRQYVGPFIQGYLSGSVNTNFRSPAADGNFRVAYPTWRGDNRLNITSWDYVTGKATYGGSRGANVYFHNISSNNDSLQSEPYPTKAIPGHLVYFYSQQDLATTAYYKARTE